MAVAGATGVAHSRVYRLLSLFQVTSHSMKCSINEKYDKQFSVGNFVYLIQMNRNSSTQVVVTVDWSHNFARMVSINCGLRHDSIT